MFFVLQWPRSSFSYMNRIAIFEAGRQTDAVSNAYILWRSYLIPLAICSARI